MLDERTSLIESGASASSDGNLCGTVALRSCMRISRGTRQYNVNYAAEEPVLKSSGRATAALLPSPSDARALLLHFFSSESFPRKDK